MFKKNKIKLLIIISFLFISKLSAQTYEFDFVTVIESIVPGGVGRSRIIAKTKNVDYSIATTIRKEKWFKDLWNWGNKTFKLL